MKSLLILSFLIPSLSHAICENIGKASIGTDVTKTEFKMHVTYTYYSGPGCKLPEAYNRDHVIGTFIEEHDYYLLMVEKSYDEPLDKIQKNLAKTDPELERTEFIKGPILVPKGN